MPSTSDSFSETFGLTRGFKGLIAFGLLFFSLGLLGSIALLLFPSFNNDPSPRWTWIACAVSYLAFIVLLISIWKKRNDTIEVTAEGIASHSLRGGDIQLRWYEITTVEEFPQRGCLILSSRGVKRIRVEHQFENFPLFLNLLEQNLAYQGSGAEDAVFHKLKSFYVANLLVLSFFAGFSVWACTIGFYWSVLMLLLALPSFKVLLTEPFKVMIESDNITLFSLLNSRVIEWKDLLDIRLNSHSETGTGGLQIIIRDRQFGKETKLIRFKSIFHLYMLTKTNHERSLP